MSDDNTKTSIKSNDLTRYKETEANSWIIGVSKSHPGQKYYFNIVTGVSLWNISSEDIDRAQQRMKALASPIQYDHYPEPNEPPPNRRLSTKLFNQTHCQHSLPTLRAGAKQKLNSESSDVTYNSENVSSNFDHCPHPDCTSKSMGHINVIPQSGMKSPTLLDNKMFERNATRCAQHSNTPKHLLGVIRSSRKHMAESMLQDVGNDETHSQNSNDKEWFEGNTCECVDLALLKQFAKSDAFEDKWYIIADASVYLQDINLITTILDNDEKCCLIITQNVKSELEQAVKTPLRAKAHYANYIIYKLLHLGLAVTDEDILKQNQDKIVNNSILNCCLKLKEQKFYVVVITNDLELEKYGQFHVPIFTLRELKKCISKTNNFVTPPITPSLVVPQSDNKTKLSTPDIMGMFSNARMSQLNLKRTNSELTEENSLQSNTLLAFNGASTRSSVDFKDITKTTTDVEVQTDLTLTQLQEMECVYKKVCLSKQAVSKETENLLSHNQSYEPSPASINRGVRKQIKLKRRKISEQSVLKGQVNVSVYNQSDTVKVSSPRHNTLENKNVNQNECSSYIPPEYKNDNSKKQEFDETDKSSNRTIQEIPNEKCNKHSNKHLSQEGNEKNENIEDKNVMFEITSEMMEKSLIMKCDEWVTKFVQIMEKALTEVLGWNSLCLSPWNLYKATAYIEKNIIDDPDIVDASKKLLNVLKQVRNEEGGINTNMSPTTYMEMYSFGVYLIDALQGKFDTCDDLQVAAESLSKLLSDIQHSVLDPDDEKVEVLMIIDSDSLNDETSENSEKQEYIEKEGSSDEKILNNARRKNNENARFSNMFIETTSSSTNVQKENSNVQFKVTIPCTTKAVSPDQTTFIDTSPKTPSHTKCIGSPSTYNLRSRLRRMSHLQEKPNLDGIDVPNTTNEVSRNVQLSGMEISEEPLNEADNDSLKLLNEVGASNKEQKVVRKFVRCLEFEERLRTNQIQHELSDLDYEDENMEMGYEDETLCDTRRAVSEERPEFYNSNEDDYRTDYEIESNKEDSIVDFKYIITKIAKEISEISSEVYGFSSRVKWNLISASEDNSDIREKAGHCFMYINKICTALNSILYRDRNGTYNMQAVLDTTEFADICIDKDQMEIYGEFIATCLEQAQTIKEVIKDVLSALRMDEGNNQIRP